MESFIAQYWPGWASALVVAALTGAFGAGYRRLSKRLKRQAVESNAVRSGMQALIRDRIVETYNRYNDKGYCPIYALENMNKLYREYKTLGGNGTVDSLVARVRELPTPHKDGTHGTP